MAWEKRKRGGSYYTRSRRVNGQVSRSYVGCGRIGELAAQMDALERKAQWAQRERERQQREDLEAVEQPLEALDAACDALVQAALQAAGYHKHKGQWRKRRGRKEDSRIQEQGPTAPIGKSG